MKTWRKGLALLLVGMMMMSGLVALSAPAVVADTRVGTENRFAVVYDGLEDYMYDERVYERDPTDESYYLLGEEDNTIDVTVEIVNSWVNYTNTANNNGNNITHVWLNLSNGGWDPAVFHVDESELPLYYENVSAVSPQNGYQFTGSWTFDTLKQSGLGLDNDKNYFELSLTYKRVTPNIHQSTANETNQTKITTLFRVYIFFHSAFDDPTGDDNIPFGADPQLMDVTAGENANGYFEAGDKFAATELTIFNYDNTTIRRLTCTITPNAGTGITLSNGLNYCTVMNIGANGNTILNYRTDVAERTAPGIKAGTAVIVYTRDDSGLQITESTVHDIEWWVDFSFRSAEPYTPPQPAGDPTNWSPFQCTATSVVILNDTRQVDYVAEYGIPQIEQSTYTDQVIRMAINVTNNGNTPIYNVQFRVDPGSSFTTGWDFFRNPRFFWQNVNPAGPLPEYDTISQMFAQINVNQTVTVTIEMVIAANVPIGVHRLPLSYDGFYFNGGELEEATGYFGINGGNGIADGTDDLTLIFAIKVVDIAISCHIEGAVTMDNDGANKGNIVAENITVYLANDEMYTFIDITVQADFTGTPWYNPIIGMSGERIVWAKNANPAMMEDEWVPYDDDDDNLLEVSFTVDTDPNMTPDTYPFSLHITAVIEETLEVVEIIVDWTQGATIYYKGYGPQIQITAFANTDIVPGQMFNMTMTIQNVGDETLRDIWIWVDSDTTEEYGWGDVIGFQNQFDWSSVFEDWGSEAGGQVTWNGEFPEDMFYTLEDLDVDNVREIVEINLYMDGVYSMPGAKITMVKIVDLAPGASFDVTYDMLADKDMVNGKPYAIEVEIWGIDPYGNTYWTGEYVTVMSSLPGESYNPVELNWFDAGLKALALFLFFIIVLAILLFVYNMFKGEPYDDDEEDFDFEDEPFEAEPMEPAPADAPQQELVEP